MAQRVTSRNKVLLARTLHPQYREVVRTYIKNLGLEAVDVPYGPDGRVDTDAPRRAPAGSFGGPYLGFMACKKEFLRQMPGRICGQTVDKEGRRGFVLTLSTREQHIRRERATSNICTNQALCALRATIFMESLGKQGLRELAWQNAQKAAYAADRLGSVPGVG